MHSRIAIAGVITALVLPLTTATAVSAHGHDQLPETIDLPAGFVGEGVAVGAHNTFYAGSVADGRVASGDLRDGISDVFVSTPIVPSATGLGRPATQPAVVSGAHRHGCCLQLETERP
jgi:hypothetical protein